MCAPPEHGIKVHGEAHGAVLLVAALVFWRFLEAGFIGERREAVALARRERIMDEERAGYAGHVGPRGLICVAFPADGRGRRAERCSYSVGVAQLDAEEALAFCFLFFVLRRSAAEASRCALWLHRWRWLTTRGGGRRARLPQRQMKTRVDGCICAIHMFIFAVLGRS